MKKKWLITIPVILILLALTNPSEQEYHQWAKEKIKDKYNNDWLNLGVDLIGSKVLETTTEPNNYLFFSVYKTSIMNIQIDTLGIFKTFIMLPTSTVESEDLATAPKQNIVEINTPAASPEVNEEEEEVPFNKLPFILINGSKSPNLSYWGPEKILEQTEQVIRFKDRSGTLTYGRDTPNGFKFRIILDNYPVSLYLEDHDYEVFDDLGEIPPDHTIQATNYDFDNDGNDEVIIAIGDGFSQGKFWVFGYSSVENVSATNPMNLLLAAYFQSSINLEDNVLMVPIGSQGLFEEYLYQNNKFYFSNNL